jgi:hypothetical protein
MNCRISENRLRGVCRELLRSGGPTSHRILRQVLRDRFGAIGKTSRVLAVWREEAANAAAAAQARATPAQAAFPSLPTDVVQLQEQLARAERRAQELLRRAEGAEFRERAHQDRWMMEIDQLRQQLRAQPDYARDLRTLQCTVTRLTTELIALRGAMSRSASGEGGAPPSAV